MSRSLLKKKQFWVLWALYTLFGLILAAAVAAALLFTAHVGGRFVVRLDNIDLRGQELSCEEYEEARAKYPEDEILWSVPLGERRFDSDAETLRLRSLPEEEVERLLYFPNLKSIDAEGCADYAALLKAQELLPNVEIRWSVPSSDGPIPGDTETLTVHHLSREEIDMLASILPGLRCIDLREAALSEKEIDAVAADYSDLSVPYLVRVWGQTLPWDCETLRLSDGVRGEPKELKKELPRLKNLKTVDMRGMDFAPSEIAALLPSFGGAEALYDIWLYGLCFDMNSEEIDLSNIPITDLSELDAAVGLMGHLKKIVMCDCGIPDEEMDALNQKYGDVRVVWMLHFSVYDLRTDETIFCAADLPPYYLAPELNDAELEPIKYCTDLIALDLGHMHYTDISFLYNMPHLKYLILVEAWYHDITPIGTLEDLEYLELFVNHIDDISPLLNCKKLKHLNLCYTWGYDPTPLMEMTWLERLWLVHGPLYGWQARELEEALPDTRCYLAQNDYQGSTGGGWREDPAYYEMRDVFGMFYMPGGTGIH